MLLRNLSVVALATVLAGAAGAFTVGGIEVGFDLETTGTIVNTDRTLTLASLNGIESRVNNTFAGTYNETLGGAGTNSNFSGQYSTGTLTWSKGGVSPSAFATTSSFNLYCLTPTEYLHPNQEYIVYRVKGYSGITGTPPPYGAGFMKDTFSRFNPASLLNTAFTGTVAEQGAIRQSLLWDFAMSGGLGATASARGLSSVTGNSAVTNGWSTNKASMMAAAQLDTASSFLVYVPVVKFTKDGKTTWQFNTLGTSNPYNPASQVFISSDPVPEPGTLALGVLGLLAAARRRRERHS